jgi:hypothetical protein
MDPVDVFDGFKFPDPVELEPMPAYRGDPVNWGGIEEVYGGQPLPELEVYGDAPGADDYMPFEVRAIRDDAGWLLTLEPGYVEEIHPQRGCADALGYWTPTINGEDMDVPVLDENDFPEIEVEVGDTVWLHILTNCEGLIAAHGAAPTEDPVRIEVFAAALTSTHHRPPNPDEDECPDGGVEGDYWIRLFSVEADGANIRIVQKWRGNYLWRKMLWMGENLGVGERVFKEYDCDADRWRFRGLFGDHGIDIAEGADDIDFNFNAENIGGHNEVYVDDDEGFPATAKAQFRTIKQRDTDPQVMVSTDGETIKVEGNGIDGSLTFLDCNEATVLTLTWTDGLMQDAGAFQVTLGDCDSGGGTGTP